jgi:hypothetical protein
VHRDRFTVSPRALTPDGGEELVLARVEHDSDLHDAVDLSRDRHRPLRQRIEVIHGAVDRVHDPSHPAAGRDDGGLPFLPQHRVVGADALDLRGDQALGGGVHLGDHIGGRGLRGEDQIGRPTGQQELTRCPRSGHPELEQLRGLRRSAIDRGGRRIAHSRSGLIHSAPST